MEDNKNNQNEEFDRAMIGGLLIVIFIIAGFIYAGLELGRHLL